MVSAGKTSSLSALFSIYIITVFSKPKRYMRLGSQFAFYYVGATAVTDYQGAQMLVFEAFVETVAFGGTGEKRSCTLICYETYNYII